MINFQLTILLWKHLNDNFKKPKLFEYELEKNLDNIKQVNNFDFIININSSIPLKYNSKLNE